MPSAPTERFDGRAHWPPWTRWQHLARYEWVAREFVAPGAAHGEVAVLDAACGVGYGSALLCDAGATTVTALDIDDASAAVAAALRPNITGLTGDVTTLPLPDESVDLYVSFETLEHVRAPNAVVGEARRVLRDGGAFIVSTPNRNLHSPGRGDSRPVNPYHEIELTIEEFRDTLLTRFAHVEILGQSFESDLYVAVIGRIAARNRTAGVRARQLSKLVRTPWQRRGFHEPGRLRAGVEPDILIAVCG